MANPTVHNRCLVCEKEVVAGVRRAFHPPAPNNCVAREFFTRFVKPSYVFPPNDDDSILLFVCRKPCFTRLEQGACRVTAVESIIRELTGSPDATLVLSSVHRPGSVGANSEPQTRTRTLSEAEEPGRKNTSESRSEITTTSQTVPGPSQCPPVSSKRAVARSDTSSTSLLGKRRLHGGSGPRAIKPKQLKIADPLILFTPLLGPNAGVAIYPNPPADTTSHLIPGRNIPLVAAKPTIYPIPQANEASRLIPGRDIPLVAAKPTRLGSPSRDGVRQSMTAALQLALSCPGPQAKEGAPTSGREVASATANHILQMAMLQPSITGREITSATTNHIPQVATLQPSIAGKEVTSARANHVPQGTTLQLPTAATASSRRSGAQSVCGPVLVTQVYGKSVRKFLVPASYRRLVGSLRYRKPGYTARTIVKIPWLKDAVVSEIAKSVSTECSSLSGMVPEPSVLRVQSIDHLKSFHWDSIITELKGRAPTLLAVLTAAAQTTRQAKQHDINTHAIAMAAAILLKQRNSHLCLPQTIIGALLHSGHAAKKVFGRLSKLGLCIAYGRVRHTVKALGISKSDPPSGLKCEEKTPGWTLPCLSLLAGPSESATTGAGDPAASPSSSSVSSPLVPTGRDEEQPVDDEEEPVGDEEQPVDDEEELVDDEEELVDDEEQPVGDEEELVDDEEQPVDEAEQLVGDEEQPVDDEEELVDDEEELVDDEPVDDIVEPFHINFL